MEQILKYKCIRCGNSQYEIGEIRTVGKTWSMIFGYHNRRFTYVSCQRCHSTEFFKVAQRDICEAFSFFAR